MKRFKAIQWYIQKYWWQYALTLVLSIGIIYCDIKKPEIIGEAVDLIGLGQIKEETLFSLLILLTTIVLTKFIISIGKSIFLGNLFHRLFYQIKIPHPSP